MQTPFSNTSPEVAALIAGEGNLARYNPLLPYVISEGLIHPSIALPPAEFTKDFLTKWDEMESRGNLFVKHRSEKNASLARIRNKTGYPDTDCFRDAALGYHQAFYFRDVADCRLGKVSKLTDAMSAAVTVGLITTLRGANCSDEDIRNCLGYCIAWSVSIYKRARKDYAATPGAQPLKEAWPLVEPQVLFMDKDEQYFGKTLPPGFKHFLEWGAVTATEFLDAILRKSFHLYSLPGTHNRTAQDALAHIGTAQRGVMTP